MNIDSFLIGLLQESGFWIATTILAAGWTFVRSFIRFRTLRRAFGRNVTQPERFFISVPLWSCKPGDRSVPRFARRGPTGALSELYGPDETFAKEDILGGMLISDLLARYFKRPLTVIPDDEKINWDGRTGILVGAQTANFHVDSLLKSFSSAHPDEILIGRCRWRRTRTPKAGSHSGTRRTARSISPITSANMRS